MNDNDVCDLTWLPSSLKHAALKMADLAASDSKECRDPSCEQNMQRIHAKKSLIQTVGLPSIWNANIIPYKTNYTTEKMPKSTWLMRWSIIEGISHSCPCKQVLLLLFDGSEVCICLSHTNTAFHRSRHCNTARLSSPLTKNSFRISSFVLFSLTSNS